MNIAVPNRLAGQVDAGARRPSWDLVLVYQMVGLCLGVVENVDRALTLPSEHHLLWKQVLAVLCAAGTLLGLGALGLERARLKLKSAASLFYPIVCAAALYPVGASLTSGSWASKQWFAPLFAPLLAVLGFGGLWCAWQVFQRLPGGRPAHVAALVVSAVALAIADARILPGSYPAFHYALLAATWVLGGLACWIAFASAIPRRVLRVATATLALSLPLVWVKAPTSSHREIWRRSASYAQRLYEPVRHASWRAVSLFKSSGGYAGPVVVWIHQQPKAEKLARRIAEESWHRARRVSDARLGPATETAPDIVLITIDTLRADVAASSERWAAIAATGKDFTRAYSTAACTHLAMATAFSGSTDQTRQDQTIIKALNAADYETAVVTDDRVYDYLMRLNQAWARDFGDVHLIRPVEKLSSHQLTRAALGILSEPRARPLFLWLHYFDLHEWFKAPAAPGATEAERYAQRWRDVEGELATVVHEVLSRSTDRPRLLLLASDHGENLDVDGRELHGRWVDLHLVRIPMVVLGSGIAPERVDDLVGIHDVAATLAAAASISYSSEGISLLQDTARTSADRVIPMGDKAEIGIVRGTERLVLTPRAGLLRLFDDTKPGSSGRVVGSEGPWRETMLLPLLGSPMSGTFTSPLTDDGY